MPTLLESSFSALSLLQLNYLTLAITVVIFGASTIMCIQCTLVNAIINFTFLCLSNLKKSFLTLLQVVEDFSTRNEAGNSHYILDVRPEYGDDINLIISDILDALNQDSLHYPVSDKLTKYKSVPRKFDVKGWRRKLNERWKKKIKFMRAILLGAKYKKDVSWNDIEQEAVIERDTEQEAVSERETIRSSRSSGTSENCTEKFVLVPKPPVRDEDNDLDVTIVYPDHLHKFNCFVAEADNDSRVPDWE